MRKLYLKNKLMIALGRPFENRRLFTPLQLNIHTLQHHGLWPAKLIALDAFCQTGLQWTRIIAPYAEYLEMWDIDRSALDYARKEFAGAQIVCGDSVEAVRKAGLSRRDYNFVLLDTPMPFRYSDGSFEHFGFFADIFKSLASKCIVIFDVVPDIKRILERHPQPVEFRQLWINARKEYYSVSDGEFVPPRRMEEVYKQIAEAAGYTVDLVSYSARNEYFGFITMAISRK
jgi:hypothetical protein